MNLLDFWYSERCTRPVRLGICTATCIIIYLLSTIQKLPPVFAIGCLSIGVITHLIRHSFQRIQQDNPYREGFKILGNVFPVMALILVMLLLPPSHQWTLGLQALGLSALGLFIVSIYQNRTPR